MLKGPNGKPLLAAPYEALHVNTSHSHNYFLIALGPMPLGVDIERIDPSVEALAIARRFFTADEAETLHRAADPLAAFYRLWTSKEALIKAQGLTIQSLSQLAVPLTDQPTPVQNWMIHPLSITGDTMATLAYAVGDFT